MSVKGIFLAKFCFNQLGFTIDGRGNLICLMKGDSFEWVSFKEIFCCRRLCMSLVVHAAHLLVDSFLIFDGAEDVGTIDGILWMEWNWTWTSILLSLRWILYRSTPVAVHHCLPWPKEVPYFNYFTWLDNRHRYSAVNIVSSFCKFDWIKGSSWEVIINKDLDNYWHFFFDPDLICVQTGSWETR